MSDRSDSREHLRTELIARVRTRRAELEQAIFARVRRGDFGAVGADDAEYVAGLQAAVAAAIRHALIELERGETRSASTPPEALAQARRAARAGVSLDTVLRRYVLGSTLLGDYLMQEASGSASTEVGVVLRELMSVQAGVLDRLLGAITSEYTQEVEHVGRSHGQRRSEQVQRLLAGSSGATIELDYKLDAWHVGLIAMGPTPEKTLQRVSGALGNRLLCVPHGDEVAWGWLGGRKPSVAHEIERAFDRDEPNAVSLAIGEPAQGLDGWRLTHRQARVALQIGLRDSRRFTRYADIALLASILRDDALAGSIVDIYLSPLGNPDSSGAVLRRTLRAYFAAEGNASSTASALGVTRRTVQNHLAAIEQKLGSVLHTRQAELEVALRLEDLCTGTSDERASTVG